jgi:hypothetical protein
VEIDDLIDDSVVIVKGNFESPNRPGEDRATRVGTAGQPALEMLDLDLQFGPNSVKTGQQLTTEQFPIRGLRLAGRQSQFDHPQKVHPRFLSFCRKPVSPLLDLNRHIQSCLEQLRQRVFRRQGTHL